MDTRRYSVAPNTMSGGFGSVTELHDRYLDRSVLYKSIRDPANNDQLVAEVRALTSIRSRHIIDIYDVDFDQHGTLSGIIIENLRGRDFLRFHAEAPAKREELKRTMYQLACAVSDLHGANIIHRDLKLENFKASEAGIVKLFDFGISSMGTQPTLHNRGTLHYAAPELFSDGAVITRACDVYALGICFWKLATHHFPRALSEMPPQSTNTPPPIQTLAQHVDNEVADIIHACIRPNPAHRPSATEVRDELASLLLRDRHKGMFFRARAPGRAARAVYELSAQQRTVRIQLPGLGELRAAYDGNLFVVRGVSGDVFINNRTAAVGQTLHDACVITFGSFSLGRDREYISFLCSKPEIVL